MLLNKLVFVFLGIYGLSLFSVKYSDELMRVLMARSQEPSVRCPHDLPESSYIALIEEGFKLGLFGETARAEFYQRRMYPMIDIDLNGKPFVVCLCVLS